MIAKRYSEKKVFKSISRNSLESTYNHNTTLFLTWSTVLQNITKNRTSLQLFYYEFDNIFQSSYSPGTSERQQSQSFWRQSCRNLIFRWVPLTNYFSALIFQYLHIVTIKFISLQRWHKNLCYASQFCFSQYCLQKTFLFIIFCCIT